MNPYGITPGLTIPGLAAWNAANKRARDEYAEHPFSPPFNQSGEEAPKTERRVGTGTGICDRCGIDSKRLRLDKCPPCYNYLLWRHVKKMAAPKSCIEDGCAEPRAPRHRRCEAHHYEAVRRQSKEHKARAEAAVRAAIRASGGAS